MKQLLFNHNAESWVGKHCETTAVKHVLEYYGLDLSEEFLFGISGGIGFIYWYAKNMNLPFIGTKNKTKKGTILEICEKLDLRCQVKETTSIVQAQKYLENAVASRKPLIVNVDIALLQYTGVPQNAHFGGHAVATFGVDQEKSLVYIFDRGKKMVSEPIESFQLARNSTFKPFSPKNRSFLIEPNSQNKLKKEILINRDMIIDSIRESVTEMMYPEIRNKGITGFDIWVKKMKKWPEDFQGLDFLGCLMNVFSNVVIGGTGGDAFRGMYASFLRECSMLLEDDKLREAAQRYETAGACWVELGQLALPDSCNYLKQIKETMYAKNLIFEESKPDTISRLLDLQQKQNQILELAAKEAEKYQNEIISDLCHMVNKCKKLEQDALSCLSGCFGD